MAMAVGGGKGATVRHQRHAADRRAAGAAHHLHGDHAADAEGTGGAGSAAASAESAASRDPDQDRTVVIIIDKDKKMMLNTEPTDETAWASD